MHLWQKHHSSDTVFFLHPAKGFTIVICFYTNDVHFDPMIKVVSTRFHHYKVSLFLLCD